MILMELIQKYKHLTDLHITRAKCNLVVISNGKIIDIVNTGELKYCPLYSMVCNADPKIYMENKIKKFGYFTPGREIYRDSLGVPYGTSEMIMFALKKGRIDCAITVCDGVGTVITDRPEVAQGIGARMNGLFYTTAIPALQKKMKEYECLVFDDARIDQVRGLKTAIEAGYKDIIITVNGYYGENFAELRRLEDKSGINLIIAAICTTGIDAKRAEEIVSYADLAWACASKHLRDHSKIAIFQITKAIPIFVYTRKGLDFISAYSDKAGAAKLTTLDPNKHYLLAAAREGCKIYFGPAKLAIVEAVLPVAGKKEPNPLT